MVEIQYRIGGLDPESPYSSSSFIVCERKPGIWSVYALDNKGWTVFHRDVVEYFHLKRKNILGGGHYRYRKSEKDLTLDDYSDDFGSLPAPVAEKVAEALAGHLRQTGIEISNITVAMRNIFKTREKRDMWRSLGFDV